MGVTLGFTGSKLIPATMQTTKQATVYFNLGCECNLGQSPLFIQIHILLYYKSFLYFIYALSVILDNIPCQFKSINFSLINALYTFLHLFLLFCLNRSKINAKITRKQLLNNYSVRFSQKSQTAQKSRGRTLVEPDTIRKPNYLLTGCHL